MFKHRFGTVAAFLLLSGVVSALPAVAGVCDGLPEPDGLTNPVFWDGGGATDDWHDAANWDNDTVPGPGDDVCIGDDFSDVTVTATSSISGARVIVGADLVVEADIEADTFRWFGSGEFELIGDATGDLQLVGSGRLYPGGRDTVGTVNVAGDLLLGANAASPTVVIDMAGDDPGVSLDQVAVIGTARLAVTVLYSRLSGFRPTSSAAYKWLAAGTVDRVVVDAQPADQDDVYQMYEEDRTDTPGNQLVASGRSGREGGTVDVETISVNFSPDVIEVGQQSVVTAIARNNGPDEAWAITVSFSASERGLKVITADAPCRFDGLWLCQFDFVPAGQTRTITFEVEATSAQDGGAFVQVRSEHADGDANPGNETLVADVTIVEATSGPARRLQGSDRIATAIAVSAATWQPQKAGAVVLARSDLFPDALAGAPLAVAKGGPLLLTPSATLDQRVQNEIERVLPSKGGTVYLLGGQAALGAGIEQALTASGRQVKRLEGPNRYATAVAIADEVTGTPAAILLATGLNFADALSAGPAATVAGGVVILTADTAMPTSSQAYLDQHQGTPVYAIGGPAASAAPGGATVISGADRYATAVDVATRFFSSPTSAGAATGTNFPDALSGAAHIAGRAGPMLLVAPTSLPAVVDNYLRNEAPSIKGVFVYGGPNAVSDAVVADLAAAVS